MPLSAGKGKKIKQSSSRSSCRGALSGPPLVRSPANHGLAKANARCSKMLLFCLAAPHGTSGSPLLGEGAPWEGAARSGTSQICHGATSAAPRLAHLQSKAEGEGEPSLPSQAGIPGVAQRAPFQGWMQPKDFFRQHRVFSGGISCCRII